MSFITVEQKIVRYYLEAYLKYCNFTKQPIHVFILCCDYSVHVSSLSCMLYNGICLLNSYCTIHIMITCLTFYFATLRTLHIFVNGLYYATLKTYVAYIRKAYSMQLIKTTCKWKAFLSEIKYCT